MELNEKITECVRIWGHSQNLTRSQIGEKIGRPRFTIYSLLSGNQAWQVRDVAALIAAGCSLPEELKQAPDDATEADNFNFSVRDGRMTVRALRQNRVIAQRVLDASAAERFAKYSLYMARRINPGRYSTTTTHRFRKA